MAGCLPPVHVSDGAAPQDAALQLPDRGPGLRGRPPGAHPTGERLPASRGSGLFRAEAGVKDAVRSAGCPRPTCQVRGMGWDQLSWNLLVRNLSHNAMPPGATTSASEGRSRCGWSLCHLVSPCVPPSQCLNAVRTVQSLACLEEADHTVGFILQLSSFMKEWHFHLPQLMRDVQVGLRRHPSAGLGTHSGAGR